LAGIPADCDISGYTTEQLLVVLRMLNASQKVLQRWYRLGVDGRAFAMMSDEDLHLYDLSHPLVRQLRNCSRSSVQKSSPDNSAEFNDSYVKFRLNKNL